MSNSRSALIVWLFVFTGVYLYSIARLNSISEQYLGPESFTVEVGKKIRSKPFPDCPDVELNLPSPPKTPQPDINVIRENHQIEIKNEAGTDTNRPQAVVEMFGTEITYTSHKDIEWLYPKPDDVPEEQLWRYKSTNLFWSKNDTLYRKFSHYKDSLELPPPSVKAEIERVCDILNRKGRNYLCHMFRQTYPNTLETTTSLLEDNTVYVITGDIPLMWMRDSSAQVHQYSNLLKRDPYIQILFEGVIRRQIQWIKLDPYGSSFRLKLDFDNVGKDRLTDWDIKSGRTIHVSMHDYEIDSLCYFLRLSYTYYKEMNECLIFEEEWLGAAKSIVELWRIEQKHNELSSYTYPILKNDGKGTATCYTGMTWGGSRPSDDPCKFHFLVPSNMFAVVVLRYLKEILNDCYPGEQQFYDVVERLELEIDEGIHKYGTTSVNGGVSYAYEVSGCGQVNFMDDANVPSLLSMDYLGYSSPLDSNESIKRHTVESILSKHNPFYFTTPSITGIGSPHTRSGYVWPMSVIIQGMKETDPKEINKIIDMLENSDAGTGFMHESVAGQGGAQFSRHWFAWANSLFSELIYTHLNVIEAR